MASPEAPLRPTDQQTLDTLFDLGRQVTSVLDLEALLRGIPDLVRRILPFEALAVSPARRAEGRPCGSPTASATQRARPNGSG